MSEELRTSAEWKEMLVPNSIIYDPDGWDRENFKQSWEEKITKEEFWRRFNRSTVRI